MHDEELIERARAGDRAAFRALLTAHRPLVMRVVRRLVCANESEDVAQEVFLHVHRSLGSFRGESRFTTWLQRLALNVARMHIRKRMSRPTLVLVGDDHARQLERKSPHSPEREVEQHERAEALDRLLEGLSDKMREVVVLHDLQGVSAQQIASTLQTSAMTVRTRLFYGRRKLFAGFAAEPALAGIDDLRDERPRPRFDAVSALAKS